MSRDKPLNWIERRIRTAVSQDFDQIRAHTTALSEDLKSLTATQIASDAARLDSAEWLKAELARIYERLLEFENRIQGQANDLEASLSALTSDVTEVRSQFAEPEAPVEALRLRFEALAAQQRFDVSQLRSAIAAIVDRILPSPRA